MHWMRGEVIDLTWPIGPDMTVAPNLPPVELAYHMRRSESNPVVSELWSSGLHVGTHVDAPFHFNDDGATVDRLHPLALCGSAVVIDVASARGRWREITGDELDEAVAVTGEKITQDDIALIRSGYSDEWRSLPPGPRPAGRAWAFLGTSAIDWLLERSVRAVGVDTPDPDRRDPDTFEAHVRLLGAGIPIIEGLARPERIATARCGFVALCLPFHGASGSPVRALALTPRSPSRGGRPT